MRPDLDTIRKSLGVIPKMTREEARVLCFHARLYLVNTYSTTTVWSPIQDAIELLFWAEAKAQGFGG